MAEQMLRLPRAAQLARMSPERLRRLVILGTVGGTQDAAGHWFVNRKDVEKLHRDPPPKAA
jgi:hypothetical protein